MDSVCTCEQPIQYIYIYGYRNQFWGEIMQSDSGDYSLCTQLSRRDALKTLAHMSTHDDFVASLEPTFLGLESGPHAFSSLSYPALTLRREEVFSLVGGMRQCFHCLKLCEKRIFPRKHVCGGCMAAVYCSRECQIASWLSGHKEECKKDTTYKNAHLLLDVCMKTLTMVMKSGRFFEHMQRHCINASLIIFMQSSDGGITICPVKKKLASCFPISEDFKRNITTEVNDGAHFRLLSAIKHVDGLNFVSNKITNNYMVV